VSVFVGITLALSIECYYVLAKPNYTPFQLWIIPFWAAFAVSIALVFTHRSKWQRLIKSVTKTDHL
jgi:tryptophan-rich sensory protein